MQKNCFGCNSYIGYEVLNYSILNFNYPLCINCQSWFKTTAQKATKEALDLYFELRKRGVPAD